MLVEALGLSKRFGRRLAVDRVSFRVEAGERVAILGPTGAGKTTLLRLLAGVLEPDAGQARVFRIDMAQDRGRGQERVGYLPTLGPTPLDLTPWAYLHFLAAVRGTPAEAVRGRVRRAAQLCALDDAINRPIGEAAAGVRRRVALAAALAHEPFALLLDEPGVGLDPEDRAALFACISAAAEERAVIVATPEPAEAQALADRILRLEAGAVAGETGGLRASLPADAAMGAA